MVKALLRWVLFAVAIIFIAWILPGISVSGFWGAMLACVIIAIINAFVKPIVEFISLPINFLTLGLFSLVINALLLMLAGWISPGFTVSGFWSAFLGAILLSLITPAISSIE